MTPAVTAREQWFRGLYDEAMPQVFGYARARLGRTDAEDVTAEVFSAAVTAIGKGAGPDEITAAWLMTVTRNKVVDIWRARERRSRALELVRSNQSIARQLSDSPNHTGEKLLIALDRIEARHRRVLIMKYVDCHTVAEIAVELEQSIAATESQLARARRALRDTYAEAV